MLSGKASKGIKHFSGYRSGTIISENDTQHDFVILCFSLLLPYYKNPFLDLEKNIVNWLGQCFLPELAN